jgi:hypothetical protein
LVISAVTATIALPNTVGIRRATIRCEQIVDGNDLAISHEGLMRSTPNASKPVTKTIGVVFIYVFA